MEFLCENDHFYKRFIEEILSSEETSLINDYLYYIKEVQFDTVRDKVSQSKLILISNDIDELQNILSQNELSELYAHRFLDNFKKLLKQNGYQNSELNIRLGEYREYVIDRVKNIPVNPEQPVQSSKNLLIMEQGLPDGSFIYKRNQSLHRICDALNELELNPDKHDQLTNDAASRSGTPNDIEVSDEENVLELLTHNKDLNSDFKEAKSQWDQFKNDILPIIKIDLTSDDLQKSIVHLHKMISSIKLEHASDIKDIESILLRENPPFDGEANYKDQQVRLRSNLYKMLTNDRHLFNQSFFNPAHNNLGEYTNDVQKKFNTIQNYLKEHLDYRGGKRTFNINDTFRLMIYTETTVVFSNFSKKGNMTEKDAFLLEDYIDILESLHNYKSSYYPDEAFESHRYIWSIIMDDLFGCSKFDAMNIFSTTLRNMENTMASVLNNSNYNYGSLNILKLIEELIRTFDDYIHQNHKLNRNVMSASVIMSSDVPNINDLKNAYKDIEEIQNILRDITKAYPFASSNNMPPLVNTYNLQNLFNKKK